MKINYSLLLTTLTLFLGSCAVKNKVLTVAQTISNQVNHSDVNQQYQIGFVIKEIGAAQNLYEQNADKYFTPASNTKLFTFYSALNFLGDSIPTFEYQVKGDSLLVWPMADATFLHPKFKSQKAFDFLKNSGKNIYLINGRYEGEKFGAGWSWDDFNDDFQAEITEFPIYANSLRVTAKDQGLVYEPNLPDLYLSEVSSTSKTNKIRRNIDNNNLTVPATVPQNFSQAVPLHLNKNIVENLFTDTLLATGMVIKPVVNLPYRQVPNDAKVMYSTPSDSLYKHMLQSSDNFMAEEILLNCAAANHLKMNTKEMIKAATDKYLNDLPDKIQWVDGSGLSRLNLFTPRTITALLQKIYDKVGNDEHLFSLLANGGKSGTLKNMFKTEGNSFVFAKSGSLSNNYCLSGYLVSKSGKKYAFSFMNNNFVQPTSTIRAEVEKVLTFIHDNY
ncbi:D-alanyl-D-alanine carboxypeptidase/D-alanyl-D-alanine-endopeptidase [Pelobium sp.]|nr:D-alanyl-D-alanine carboxypeptidase/D-alanyl-D-alanine-endopeptidase [Pelobium sp.]MDA9554804.1 D-alanyl-D-alanine carboxypeptidase/D-alanyl-D-alanine-endopeptidase [Pelobium sp.]